MLLKKLFIVSITLTIVFVAGCFDLTEQPTEPIEQNKTLLDEEIILSSQDVDGKEFSSQSNLINSIDVEDGEVPDITSSCILVHVPFYSQNDPAFRDEKLGYSSYWTIGNSGCYLTCISMLYAKWGYYNMNPKTLNNWSYRGKAHYAFYDNSAYINSYTAIQYPGICRNVRNISKNRNAVINELRRGKPVLAKTNWYGGSHFVLIYGWDGYRFWAKDPVKNWQSQNQPVTAGLHEVYYLKVLGG